MDPEGEARAAPEAPAVRAGTALDGPDPNPEAPGSPDGEPEEGKKKRKRKMGGSKRGIETMFRTAYRTHLDLSTLADRKANMLISINGIIISVIVAASAMLMREDPLLLLPAGVLLVSAMVSVVFAVVTAIPRVSGGEVTIEDVRAGKGNILFFGTFSQLDKEDYLDEVAAVMRDKEDVYERMAEDLYNLGGVLAKKYRMIRIAYLVFLLGLVAGVTLMILVYAMTGGGPTTLGI